MKLTKAEWLAQYDVSNRDRELLAHAYDVLAHNTYEGDYVWGKEPIISPWRTDWAGIWGWDTAFHVMAVRRYDTELCHSCMESYLKFQLDNGLFPDCISITGAINDKYSKPPVLPWASVLLYQCDGDRAYLRKCYDRYVKNEAYWYEKRRLGEFFYYIHGNESGWDNSVRWDMDITRLWPIDLMCFMIMMYRALAFMAKELGDMTRLCVWNEREAWLAHAVEERFFDEAQGSYADVIAETGTFSHVLSPASFMPLYIGIASNAHAAAMEKIALEKFHPGMPTVSYDDPAYSLGYWRGVTWLNVAYFAIKGLKNYGFDKTADEMREYLLSMIYDNRGEGIFENYDSKARKGCHCNYFSWSAAFIMEMILNWG